MFLKYIWLLPIIAAIYLLHLYEYHKDVNLNSIHDLNITAIYSILFGKSIHHTTEVNAEHRMFTINELKRYTTLENGLYLSILGQVFDVTKGAKHYGPGATYYAFTGRDASLAFVTGEFDSENLTDDVSKLKLHQLKALDNWVQFYHKNYIYKGKLIGRYYNADGSSTVEFYNLQQKLKEVMEQQLQEEHVKRKFPPCNIEWKADMGTRIWCTNKSGGITRDWIGVPKMFFESPNSQQYRCACVNVNSKEYQERKGNFREYSGCEQSSVSCIIQSPKS